MHPAKLKFTSLIQGRHIWLLGGIFLLVHLALLLAFGIETGLESEKYIEQGTRLWQGEGLGEKKYIFYAPVILLVWLVKSIGLPLASIIVFQVLLSAFAQYCFYRVMKKLAGAHVAFTGSLLLLFFLPYQLWNFFLYSDSIFMSLVLLFGCSIYHATQTRSMLQQGLPLLMLALVFFSRPNGMFLIPPYIVFLMFQKKTVVYRLLNSLLALALVIAAAVCANYVFAHGEDMNILVPYIEEHIICFVPTGDASATLDISRSGNALADLWYYITHNTGHFFKMIFLRLRSLFMLGRPYYGTGHNLYLTAYSLALYAFTIAGLKKFIDLKTGIKTFVLSLLILYPLAVSLQCDDWHSRFIMIIFPYLCFLAAFGIKSVLNFIFPDNK